MPNFIKLPSERVEQLRALSRNLDLSIADCIGQFIEEQIEKGNLEADVPGFRILIDGEAARLKTEEIDVRFSSKTFLEDAAKSIRAMVTPSKDNPMMPLPDGFGLSRRGTSLKIKDTVNGAEITLAPSIASDVADMMERAAKS